MDFAGSCELRGAQFCIRLAAPSVFDTFAMRHPRHDPARQPLSHLEAFPAECILCISYLQLHKHNDCDVYRVTSRISRSDHYSTWVSTLQSSAAELHRRIRPWRIDELSSHSRPRFAGYTGGLLAACALAGRFMFRICH
jgi:hypothetical protein